MAPLLTEHFQTGILQKMIYYMNVHMIYQCGGYDISSREEVAYGTYQYQTGDQSVQEGIRSN